jgi:hypothetical protein
MVLKRLTSNFISFAGLLITSVSLVFIVLILIAAWLGFESNPYVGVVAFLILPGFALFGLVMMPLGKAWERRRAGHPMGLIRLEIDLEKPRTRRRIMTVVIVASVLFAVLGATTYQSVRFMDTTTFCGEVCHSVMQPELTSYRHSPHARVPCVECHIGEGADWYVKSKLSGIGQVIAVTFNTYDRPIPTPVQNLRPARETCEKCHWPEEFHSYKLVVKSHFQEDSANTLLKNVLLMKVGGGSAKSGGTEGIHWHMNIKNKIEYVALDRTRDTIGYVKMTDLEGRSTEFVAKDLPYTIDQLRAMPRRTMDCMDCHSRPSHVFEVPEVAVDEALVTTDLPTDLPFIRREGVRILKQDYPSRDDAVRDIRVALRSFYHDQYPELAVSQADKIDKAADQLGQIYLRNVFPEMKITWGTYRNFIGHTYTNGCFRCHDEEHVSPEGRTISQDCNACHEVLAFEEANPKPVLDSLPRR